MRNENRENIAQREIITRRNIYMIRQFAYVHLAFHSACHIIVELWLFKPLQNLTLPRGPTNHMHSKLKNLQFLHHPKDTVVRMLRISRNALHGSSFFWHKPVQNILSTSLCIIIQQVTHIVCCRLRMFWWNHPECALCWQPPISPDVNLSSIPIFQL